MSDLIERAEKCAEEYVGTLGRDMIEELVEEIVRLNGKLVTVREEVHSGTD